MFPGASEGRVRVVFVSIVFLLFTACSINQVKVDQPLTPSRDQDAVFKLHTAATLESVGVRTVELLPDTHWHLIGSIPRGRVFEPLDQVVTVNGFNVHEAYIVVHDGRVTGYYLPFEKSFVEVESVAIKLVRNRE